MAFRPRAAIRLPRQVLSYLRSKPVTWFDDEGVGASRYPRTPVELQDFAAHGVALVVNLHERPHPPGALAQFGLNELHLPVKDFHSPTDEQIDAALAAIDASVSSGQRVVVHCGGGLGRTGTLVACYLVARGMSAEDALHRVRSARPGSVETPDQEAAVAAYAARIAAQ
jgi:atypical dual specificity phosphatase